MRFSPLQLVGAAAVALSLAIGGVALRARDSASLDAARSDAHKARVALESAIAQSVRMDSVAAAAVLRSRIAGEREQRAKLAADSASRSLAVFRERYRAASAVVPDTCRPIKAIADSALASADSVIASQGAALVAADDRAAHLQFALDTTSAALTKLRAAAMPAVVAFARYEKVENPSLARRLLSKLTPRAGLGVAAGVDAFGKPNAVTGIMLGWSF